jgi:hypothetical protein
MMLPTSIARMSFVASLALMAAAATAESQPPARSRMLAGVSYVIRVGGAPATGNGMAAAMPSQTPNYTANAIFAAGRGRLDVVDGGVESLFAKGDYVLFDSTDLVIVHPATREFIALPQDAASRRMDQLQARGMKLSISDVKVSMDSVPGTDTVAGHPTRRFRMTTAFTMTVDAGALQQRLTTESVTDYWTATVPGLPGNPLLRANGFSGSPATTGMFKDLSSRIDSAAAQLGNAVALRTVTSSRLTQGPESTLQMQQTSEVSDIKNREIDESLLLLPPGYKQGAVPGLDGAAPRDAGAKWRVRPTG